MKFKDYLKESASQIDEKLELYFKVWRKRVTDVDPRLAHLIDATIEACRGGKRIRATLVKFGYEIAGGKEEAIIDPAIAFEIFQTAILIHDDIIDKSPLRRGKKTVYMALGGDHYAISQAICLGDIGFFEALKTISNSNFDEKLKNKAVTSFVDAMTDTAFGEILDVELPNLKGEKTTKDIETIFRLKTSRYTLVGPMQLGAILAGADEKLVKAIKVFGDNLGIAFQIQDDILGIFGSEKEIGKSVTSDIEEGKLTYLFLYAKKKASSEQRAILQKYYGGGQIGEKELEQIRAIFRETGALDYSRQVALEYVDSAKKVITEITDDKNYQQMLKELADYLVKRDK